MSQVKGGDDGTKRKDKKGRNEESLLASMFSGEDHL